MSTMLHEEKFPDRSNSHQKGRGAVNAYGEEVSALIHLRHCPTPKERHELGSLGSSCASNNELLMFSSGAKQQTTFRRTTTTVKEVLK